jgi:hypothetical protein
MTEQAHTDTGDLVEFLLARISEDERENRGRRQIVVGCKQMIEADIPGVEVYKRTLRQLANRYSDHPGYRPDWRP